MTAFAMVVIRAWPTNDGRGTSDVPRLFKISTMRVTPGSPHQFIARAKRSEDNPSATSAEVSVCFSVKDPRATTPHDKRNPTTCHDNFSSSEVLKKDVWSNWRGLRFPAVPVGRTWAQVKLITHATSAGTVSWDDVALYAIGELEK